MSIIPSLDTVTAVTSKLHKSREASILHRGISLLCPALPSGHGKQVGAMEFSEREKQRNAASKYDYVKVAFPVADSVAFDWHWHVLRPGSADLRISRAIMHSISITAINLLQVPCT